MVMSDFDGGFGHADHRPAMVEFKGVAHISQPNQKIRWDFNKMTKKEAQDVFAESLSTLPLRKKDSDLSCRKAHSMAYNSKDKRLTWPDAVVLMIKCLFRRSGTLKRSCVLWCFKISNGTRTGLMASMKLIVNMTLRRFTRSCNALEDARKIWERGLVHCPDSEIDGGFAAT